MEKQKIYTLYALKDEIEDPILNKLAAQMIKKTEKLLIQKEEQPFSLKIETELSSGQIYLDTLSIMSNGIQHLYSNVYNFLSGNKNEIGRLPRYILNESKLILNESLPGSYDMQIIPRKLNLLIDTKTILDNFIKQSIEEENYSNLIEEYGVRSFRSYGKWIKTINSNKIIFSFKSPYKERVYLTKELLIEIQKRIENTALIIESEDFKVYGTLSKIDTTSKSLRIESEGEAILATVHESTPMDGLVSELAIYKLSGKKEISYYPHSKNEKTEIIIDNIIIKNDTLYK